MSTPYGEYSYYIKPLACGKIWEWDAHNMPNKKPVVIGQGKSRISRADAVDQAKMAIDRYMRTGEITHSR